MGWAAVFVRKAGACKLARPLSIGCDPATQEKGAMLDEQGADATYQWEDL